MVEWHSDKTRLPLVAVSGSARSGPTLGEWLGERQSEVEDRLRCHGAILFRGFGVSSLEEFQAIAGVFCPSFGDYAGGNSPRTQVASHVFTATGSRGTRKSRCTTKPRISGPCRGACCSTVRGPPPAAADAAGGLPPRPGTDRRRRAGAV